MENKYFYLKDYMKRIRNDFQSMLKEVTILIKIALKPFAKKSCKNYSS